MMIFKCQVKYKVLRGCDHPKSNASSYKAKNVLRLFWRIMMNFINTIEAANAGNIHAEALTQQSIKTIQAVGAFIRHL